MADTPMKPELWSERSVEDTLAVYSDWAETYDTDVSARGYHTPARLAEALMDVCAPETRILDYGCGTGLSGIALKRQGFTAIDGTDISPEMLAQAKAKSVYRSLWRSNPGEAPENAEDYGALVAAGVVSLGAAPPETLDLLASALSPGALLALSFNDPTLEDGRYDARLAAQVDQGRLELLFRAHGPHLDDMKMGSDVIVLKRL